MLDFGQVDFSKPIEYFELEAVHGYRAKLRGWGKDLWKGMQPIKGKKPVRIKFDGRLKPVEKLAQQGGYFQCWATVGVIGLLRYGRPPPLLPEVFAIEIEKRTFTNDADVEKVKTMYNRVCTSSSRRLG